MKTRLLSLGSSLALVGAVGFGTAETAQGQGGGDAFKQCVDARERAGFTFPQAVQYCSTGGRR